MGWQIQDFRVVIKCHYVPEFGEDCILSDGDQGEGLHPCQDDESQTEQEEEEHEAEQAVDGRRGTTELLPHKDAPQGSDHRSALTQGVGDGRTCLTRSDVAETRTQTPDATAQHTRSVRGDATSEVCAIANRFAHEGETHSQCVEHEVARQHAQREDEDG